MTAIRSTFDKLLLMKDAGLLAASAACQVGGADKVVDVGQGLVQGDVVLDVSAIEVASGDEIYRVELQGSDFADFNGGGNADIRVLADLPLGAATPTGHSDATAAGRQRFGFTNEHAGVIYRYLRLYVRIAGMVATGINFTAYLAKRS
jgi:hypothetical protein